MGTYKIISNVIGIYISICFLLSCGGNIEKCDALQRQYEDSLSYYKEKVDDMQEFRTQSRKRAEDIDEITQSLAYISGAIFPGKHGTDGVYFLPTQIDKIRHYIKDVDMKLKNAKKEYKKYNDLEKKYNELNNLASIATSLKENFILLEKVNNAWIAFNKTSYTEAYSLFLLSDESGKREGSRAFLNKALLLIAARNGECDATAKTFLLQAQKLNDTQEIRDLINKCK
jgi:hypothetical protein